MPKEILGISDQARDSELSHTLEPYIKDLLLRVDQQRRSYEAAFRQVNRLAGNFDILLRNPPFVDNPHPVTPDALIAKQD